MKIILVTGGMGFIGSNFIRYILGLNEDFKIINVDKLTYAGHDLRYAMNQDKITKELSWKPEVDFDKGLKMTVK